MTHKETSMNRIASIALATLVIGLLSMNALAAEPTNAEEASRVLASFHAALQRGDAVTAASQLAADATIYESGYAETRADYLAHHLQGDIAFAKTTKTEIQASQQQCSVSLCLLTHESETSGLYKGKSVRSLGLESAVLRREGDAWKIVHVHWSSRK
jgi:ketosteroid isomerase-like protein